VQPAGCMGFLLAGRMGYQHLGCIDLLLLVHKDWPGRSCLDYWPRIARDAKGKISDCAHHVVSHAVSGWPLSSSENALGLLVQGCGAYSHCGPQVLKPLIERWSRLSGRGRKRKSK